jgi:hypothetical protein
VDDVYDVVVRIKNTYAASPEKLMEDAAVVVNILSRLAEEKRVQAVLLSKTPLVPGEPRELLGSQRNVYIIANVKRKGYAVPLARFVKMFLDSEYAEEELS